MLIIAKHPQDRIYECGNYSSLITDDIRHKGESVGADYKVNKPQVESILRHLSTIKL